MSGWVAGATVVGAVIGSKASSKAAGVQAAAADRASELQREQFERQVELQAPWRQAGERALGNYVNLPYYNAESTIRYGVAEGQPNLSLKMFLAMAKIKNGEGVNAMVHVEEAVAILPDLGRTEGLELLLFWAAEIARVCDQRAKATAWTQRANAEVEQKIAKFRDANLAATFRRSRELHQTTAQQLLAR